MVNLSFTQLCTGPHLPCLGVSRSPSSSRESAANIVLDRQKAYTRSLPRSQLNLNKRGSGVWSKPPTPGPYSPTTSDNGE